MPPPPPPGHAFPAGHGGGQGPGAGGGGYGGERYDEQVAMLRSPVTHGLDPTALQRLNPAAALATTFLGLRQNVMQFRFALGTTQGGMGKGGKGVLCDVRWRECSRTD